MLLGQGKGAPPHWSWWLADHVVAICILPRREIPSIHNKAMGQQVGRGKAQKSVHVAIFTLLRNTHAWGHSKLAKGGGVLHLKMLQCLVKELQAVPTKTRTEGDEKPLCLNA